MRCSHTETGLTSDNVRCSHTEAEDAIQTFCLHMPQYTDTKPTSSSGDPVTPGTLFLMFADNIILQDTTLSQRTQHYPTGHNTILQDTTLSYRTQHYPRGHNTILQVTTLSYRTQHYPRGHNTIPDDKTLSYRTQH